MVYIPPLFERGGPTSSLIKPQYGAIMNFSSIFPILSFICLLLSNQSFAQNQIDKTLLLSFAGVYSVLSNQGFVTSSLSLTTSLSLT